MQPQWQSHLLHMEENFLGEEGKRKVPKDKDLGWLGGHDWGGFAGRSILGCEGKPR